MVSTNVIVSEGNTVNPGNSRGLSDEGKRKMSSNFEHAHEENEDLLCSVRQTQDHIVVLRTVKSRTEQFLAFQKFSGKDAEMTDIIVGS